MAEKVRTVLLDLGGVLAPDPWETLVDGLFGGSREACRAALDVWNRFARASATQEEYWRSFGARLGASVDPVVVAEATNRLLVPFPWCEELLAGAAERFDGVGLISNTTSFWFEHYAERVPIGDISADLMFLSYRCGCTKEDIPGLFEAAAHVVDPPTTLVIDDREKNVQRARSAGFRAMLFDPSNPIIPLH